MLSEYRSESSKEGLVELRDADDTVSWGWTSIGEWLTYTVTVSECPGLDNNTVHLLVYTFCMMIVL